MPQGSICPLKTAVTILKLNGVILTAAKCRARGGMVSDEVVGESYINLA